MMKVEQQSMRHYCHQRYLMFARLLQRGQHFHLCLPSVGQHYRSHYDVGFHDFVVGYDVVVTPQPKLPLLQHFAVENFVLDYIERIMNQIVVGALVAVGGGLLVVDKMLKGMLIEMYLMQMRPPTNIRQQQPTTAAGVD